MDRSPYLDQPLRSEAKARDEIAAAAHADCVAKWKARIATDWGNFEAQAAADLREQSIDPSHPKPTGGQIVSLAETLAIESRTRKINQALSEIAASITDYTLDYFINSVGDAAAIRKGCAYIAEALDELRALADAIERVKP